LIEPEIDLVRGGCSADLLLLSGQILPEGGGDEENEHKNLLHGAH
jgi:hypothetical protein